MNADKIAQWRANHELCIGEPAEITTLAQARDTLDDHGGHPEACRQLGAALDYVSVVR